MDCKQVLVLKLFFAKPEFYTGDFIKGTLLLESERPSILEKIVFEINKVENWGFEGCQPVSYSEIICSFDLDLNNGKTLTKIQNCYIMPGGKNKIPFNFKINKQLLPSFEYPLQDKFAFLRYHFNIKIYSSSFIKLVWNHYLNLLSRPVINLQKELLTKTIEKNVKKWNLISAGSSKLTVTIPENNYKINSGIKVTIVVDNTLGKEQAKEVKIKFLRIIEFFGTKKEVKFNEEISLCEVKLKTPVLPGHSQAFQYTVPIKENDIKRYAYNKTNSNPYGLNLNNILYYMPTVQGKIFSCKYELRVSLYFNSFVSYNDRPRAIFPIYIIHQTVNEYQSEIQRQIEQNLIKQEPILERNNRNKKQLEEIKNKNRNEINMVNNDDNLPSFNDINNGNSNNNITLSGNNMEDADYSNQFECAPVAFQEPNNNNNNFNGMNQNPPPIYANNNNMNQINNMNFNNNNMNPNNNYMNNNSAPPNFNINNGNNNISNQYNNPNMNSNYNNNNNQLRYNPEENLILNDNNYNGNNNHKNNTEPELKNYDDSPGDFCLMSGNNNINQNNSNNNNNEYLGFVDINKI